MSVEVLYSLTEISRAVNIEYRRLQKLAQGIEPVGYKLDGKGLYKLEQFDGIAAKQPAKLVPLALAR